MSKNHAGTETSVVLNSDGIDKLAKALEKDSSVKAESLPLPMALPLLRKKSSYDFPTSEVALMRFAVLADGGVPDFD